MVRRVAPLLATWMLLGCGEASAARDAGPLREQYALSRVGIDPLTEVGHLLVQDPSLASQLGLVFSLASCDGAAPILVVLDGESAARGIGTLTLLIGQPEQGEPCAGTGVFSVDDVASFGPDGAPRVRGPLYVEGRTVEARIPISRINPTLLGFLPAWWSVTARRAQGTELFGDTEARSLWRVRQLAEVAAPGAEGRSLLDQLVALGAQPDLDVDRDGLERLLDRDGDGRVDGCVDGDGTAWEGADCFHDGRFADGFELVLRFRLVPATMAGR